MSQTSWVWRRAHRAPHPLQQLQRQKTKSNQASGCHTIAQQVHREDHNSDQVHQDFFDGGSLPAEHVQDRRACTDGKVDSFLRFDSLCHYVF